MSDHPTSFSDLARLLRYARAHHGQIALASLCSVLNKLFDIMPEILIGMAIDVVVRQEESFMAGLGLAEPFHQILALGGLTILVWGFESLFEFLLLVLWRNTAQRLQHDLRLDAYGHLQDLDMAWFEDSATGNLVAILNDDVNQLERFLNGGANDLRGGYVQAGWFPVTKYPGWPEQLELAARLALVDPDLSGIGSNSEFTLGANWFFNGHRNKLTADVTALNIEDSAGKARDLRFRVQWDISL